MDGWINRALALYDSSRGPVPHELNELDWKQDLSPDSKRCIEHLIAFANFPGGGFLVFGVDNHGKPVGVSTVDVDHIVTKLTNLARAAVDPPLRLQHEVTEFDGASILLIHIEESPTKPVAPKGRPLDESFIRMGGSTRRASRQEIGTLMLHSKTPKWEELSATTLMDDFAILEALDSSGILGLKHQAKPTSQEGMLNFLESEGLINRDPRGGGHITNLGAIAASRHLNDFSELVRKAVRVVVYSGTTRNEARLEQLGQRGYAPAFEGLMTFVTSQLPQSEVIDRAFRQKMPIYPEVALREVIANALIHQDFSISGAGPMIEVFLDRVEISNPGGLLPSKRADRLLATPSESRNERLARAFRMYGICEERGSGLYRAASQVEMYGLPPMKFEAGSNYFKVTFYSPRTYAQMSVSERLEACYQHACIQYIAGSPMTNKSLRERLRMPESRRSMVSQLIQQAQDSGLIKPADPENRSKKFMQYLPAWA